MNRGTRGGRRQVKGEGPTKKRDDYARELLGVSLCAPGGGPLSEDQLAAADNLLARLHSEAIAFRGIAPYLGQMQEIAQKQRDSGALAGDSVVEWTLRAYAEAVLARQNLEDMLKMHGIDPETGTMLEREGDPEPIVTGDVLPPSHPNCRSSVSPVLSAETAVARYGHPVNGGDVVRVADRDRLRGLGLNNRDGCAGRLGVVVNFFPNARLADVWFRRDNVTAPLSYDALERVGYLPAGYVSHQIAERERGSWGQGDIEMNVVEPVRPTGLPRRAGRPPRQPRLSGA